jgi:tetratricopeptide (TPR) repeat protein
MFSSEFRKIACFLLITLLFLGCVYYNTFYNAKKYYYLARQSQVTRLKENPYDSIKVNSQESDDFKKSIEKSSKVLEQYPTKKKYIDQAILLLGKAFYHKAEYSKAERKFTELVNNYTQSRLYWEASYYLGMSMYQKDRYGSAQKAFETLIREDSQNTIWSLKAKYMLAQIAIDKDHQEIAMGLLEKHKGLAKDKYLSNLMHYKIATIEHQRGNYQKALGNYNKVTYIRVPQKYQDLKVEPEMEYRAQFSTGECLQAQKKPAKALKHYDKMMGKDEFFEHFKEILLQTGYCYMEMDSIEKAMAVFQRIPVEYKKTQEAGEALYNLGMIYEKKYKDLEKALMYYDSSVAEFGTSENAELARVRSESFRKLKKLRGQLMAAAPDSADTTDTLAAKQKETMATDLPYAQKHYAIAEIFLFELEMTDSALAEFDSIIMDTVMDSVYTPKAWYGKAWTIDNLVRTKKDLSDSLYRYVIANFSHTRYAQASQEALELDVTLMTKEDSALNSFHRAESYFGNEEMSEKAIQLYKEVVDSFPGTLYALKAQLTIAWTYNNILYNLDSAQVAYAKLKNMTKDREESPFFQLAKIKLEGVKLDLADLFSDDESTSDDEMIVAGTGPDIVVRDVKNKKGDFLGKRTKASITRAVQINMRDEVLPLYLEILKDSKRLKGDVKVSLHVSKQGEVNYFEVDYGEIKNGEIEVSLEQSLDLITLAPVEEEGDQTILLTLSFYNTKDRPPRKKPGKEEKKTGEEKSGPEKTGKEE